MNATHAASGAEMPALLKQRVVDFAASASIEITPHDEQSLPELGRLLPAGATVYVAHTPKLELADVVRFSAQVEAAGFSASPHLVARALKSETQLDEALARLAGSGCNRVLLVAGDYKVPAGPYPSTLEVLASGALEKHGFRTIAVAGHPEGNPVIGPDALLDALVRKQAYATQTGARLAILTQFAFNPEAVIEWCRDLRARGITLPIHVGLAGPTPLPKLIRYAMRCGIGASLRTLTQKSNGLASLANLAQVNTTPDEMIMGLVTRLRAGDDIVQPHLFSFGGCVETASWMRAVRTGAFSITPDTTGFTTA